MTVYVWRNPYQKPRVQHLRDHAWKGRYAAALCQACDVVTAEDYSQRRAAFALGSWRKSTLAPIDYDALPMCKRCVKASTP